VRVRVPCELRQRQLALLATLGERYLDDNLRHLPEGQEKKEKNHTTLQALCPGYAANGPLSSIVTEVKMPAVQEHGVATGTPERRSVPPNLASEAPPRISDSSYS
jgi:hypothetical protein